MARSVARASRRLREALRTDSGIGLPELLVAMTLLAILMTIVVSVYTSFTRSFTLGQSATDSTNIASVGMNEVTRVVRSATEIEVASGAANTPAFVTAKNESATVYALVDADSAVLAPVMVQFAVDQMSRDMVERRWAATRSGDYWTFPSPASPPASSRVVARKIVVPSAGEKYLFTYLKTEGCLASEPTCAIVPASGDALSQAEIRTIVAVEVTMKVQADETARAEPVTLTNRVGIPNLGRSRVG